jgi:hypothetical protein
VVRIRIKIDINLGGEDLNEFDINSGGQILKFRLKKDIQIEGGKKEKLSFHIPSHFSFFFPHFSFFPIRVISLCYPQGKSMLSKEASITGTTVATFATLELAGPATTVAYHI